MIVVACKLSLHFPAVHSLKEKRHILSKICSRTLSRFKVSVAEVGAQDLWQKTDLGYCCVGNNQVLLESVANQIQEFIESMQLGEILDAQRESYRL